MILRSKLCHELTSNSKPCSVLLQIQKISEQPWSNRESVIAEEICVWHTATWGRFLPLNSIWLWKLLLSDKTYSVVGSNTNCSQNNSGTPHGHDKRLTLWKWHDILTVHPSSSQPGTGRRTSNSPVDSETYRTTHPVSNVELSTSRVLQVHGGVLLVHWCRHSWRLVDSVVKTSCLLWIDKVRVKEKTYMWVSVQWETRR